MARENRVREIEQVVTAHRQLEGGGFVVRRPFPGEIDSVDPFLLIDEMGPVDYAPGEAIGAPDHPHRGFETSPTCSKARWRTRIPPDTAASWDPAPCRG